MCETVLRLGSFAADVAAARQAGVVGIGVDAAAIAPIGAAEARRILDGEGVQASSFLNITAIGGRSEGTEEFDMAAEVGAPVVVLAAGPLADQSVTEADMIWRVGLMGAAMLAGARGMVVGLEPVHPLMRHWSYVHTVEHALALIDGLPGIGITLDVGHVWWQPNLAEIIAANVDRIVTVQLTDVDPTALAEFRYERAELGSGGDVPVAALVTALEAAGYRGWYENEVITRAPRGERVERLRASREWLAAI